MSRRTGFLAILLATACGADDGPRRGLAPVDAPVADGVVSDVQQELIDAALIDAGAIDAQVIDAQVIDAQVIDARPIDAALDAGAPDAGAIDARPVDAAIDARPVDAAIDARPVDAAIDARPLDAGAIDAPLDAGPIDGGVQNPELIAACGAMPVTFDDWEDCYEKRKCEWEVGCVTLNTYRSVSECITEGDAVSHGQRAAERRERKRAVDQGRAAISVGRFTQCLLETSETHCNTALFFPACLTRFDGTRADGASCLTEIECASPDAVCMSSCTDACCLGTCQRKFRVGETCTDRHSCEPGLQCNLHRLCISGDIDTFCDNDTDCDSNAWCDRLAQRCKADFAQGSECTNPLQCGGQASCVGLSVSTTDPGHCFRISEPGDTCDSFCYGALYCDVSGHCHELPKLGEGCSGLTPCAGVDTVCNGTTCVPRSDVGVTCNNQSCLPGLFCTSELNDPNPRCAARRADGQPCRSPGHCQSYLCSGNMGVEGVCLPWSNTCALAVPLIGPIAR